MGENKTTFEEKLKRLEEIVKSLEDASAPLDQSLQLFEEGVGIVRGCTTMLDNAEQKVKILAKNEKGEVVEKDFTSENEKA